MKYPIQTRPILQTVFDYTMSTLNVWYLIGRYSHAGGPLNTIEFALNAVNGAVSLDWGLFPVNTDGTPGTQIVGGTGLTPAVGWNVINVASPPTLDARKWYYFGVKLTGGTSITWELLDSQHLVMMDTPPAAAYTWDGTTLTRVKGQSFWNVRFDINGDKRGNPFTHLALTTYYGAGNSYVLPEPVKVYGAYIASAQPVEQTYSYDVRLYECNTSFIPTTLKETVNVIPRPTQDSASNAQLYVEFSQSYQLQNFSIVVVRTTTAIRSREVYDGYTGSSSRKNDQYGFVKMITSSDGTSWSVKQVSGCDVVYVMHPLFEIGGVAGGGGTAGFPFPPHLIVT